jgi:acyl-CoA thioester hydrolase
MSEVAPDPRFVQRVRPTPADIDELGHVSNIATLRWVQDVAVAHSHALGWGWDRYRAVGGMWVVRRHELDYLAQIEPAHEVELRTWVERWRAASCVRRTDLVRVGDGGAGGAEVVVARAATTWAFVQWPAGRPTRIPDELRRLFAGA